MKFLFRCFLIKIFFCFCQNNDYFYLDYKKAIKMIYAMFKKKLEEAKSGNSVRYKKGWLVKLEPIEP